MDEKISRVKRSTSGNTGVIPSGAVFCGFLNYYLLLREVRGFDKIISSRWEPGCP